MITLTLRPSTVRRPEPRHSNLYFVWRGVIDDRLARIALAMILVFIVCAVFAPLIAPYDPTEADPALRLRPPGTEGHLLGLDNQGRDILSRLIYGARITLLAGVIPVVFGALISIPLGLIGAWYRRFGEIVMRFMDVLFAFPMVLLAVMLAALMGPGLGNMLIALVIVLVPYNTRVVYAEACQQRGQAYVEAARATATPDIKILFVEMLPNVVAASVVYSCTIVGSIVITAAGLSFLGLGIQPPAAEWGIMTSEGRTYLFVAPYISTIPGIAITLLVIAFNLLGDSLRDALDPRTRLQLIRRKETSKTML
jgi:ABC-type dipeptide/oligopeptide/nickel transport system permease subunit